MDYQNIETTPATMELFRKWESIPRDGRFARYDEMRRSKEAAGLPNRDAIVVTLRQWEEDEAGGSEAIPGN